MMITTQFPVPGENYVDRDGDVRGVKTVSIDAAGIMVGYLTGEPEFYPHKEAP